MPVNVKICGLTSLRDAEWAVESGANAVGFVYERTSPRCLDLFEGGWDAPGSLAPYVLTVGVVGNLVAPQRPFHLIQYVNWSSDGYKPDVPLLRAVRVGPEETLESLLNRTKNLTSILLDALHPSGFGGTGQRIDWGLAADFVAASPARIILAGGLTPENVGTAVKQVRPYAVDVASGVEISPGVKDSERVRRFVDEAKGAI